MREQQEKAVGASRTAGGRGSKPLNYRRGLIVATIAALLMTLIGGFGTNDVPIVPRLAYWLIVMESGALIGMGASAGVRGWGGLVDRPIIEGASISLLIALPLTLVVLGVTLAFFGGRAPALAGLGAMFVGVFVVTAVITAINYSRAPAALEVAPISAADQSTEQPMPPRLLGRLPPHFRHAELYAIEAEDHYLRVHTSAGSGLILLRMTDAMGEVEGVAGARTHRSWWVARSAVQSVERGDGRAELTLPGNVVAPVSRSFMRQLQALGWFA